MAMGWILFFHSLVLSLAMVSIHLAQADDRIVPAVYIFGDSTVDVGTNNYIPECQAKANTLFNGIDFPHSKPTGRFSNGLNTADELVRLMGYELSPPPFFELLSRPRNFQVNIQRGVNFASGGSGLLNQTGQHKFGKVISMQEQVQQFQTVQENITQILGAEKTASLLSRSLFFISTGSNDIFEYFDPAANRTQSPPDFLHSLLSAYYSHLQNLFNLGARKFGIVSAPPLGCCPSLRSQDPNGDCNDGLNEFAAHFHASLNATLVQLSSESREMKYSLGNTFDMTLRIIEDPPVFFFKDVKTACCGNGSYNGESKCDLSSNLCEDRNERLFWDRFHPTEHASYLAALTFFGGDAPLMTPMNFSVLAQV